MSNASDGGPGAEVDPDALDTRVTPPGHALAVPDPPRVVALLVMGRNAELELSPVQTVFTLGGASRPEVDLPLDDRSVSRLHARVERADNGNKLRVMDQGSRNGTYYRGFRDENFEIGPGDRFRVADVELLALDENLKALRKRLQWMLGFDPRMAPAIDEALAAIGSADQPLLIIGPAGADQAKLAAKIHERSARRALGFANATRDTPAEGFGEARGTNFLDLTNDDPGTNTKGAPLAVRTLPAALVAAILRGRAIVAARSETHATAALGEYRGPRLHPIRIPPIAARSGDVLRLLGALINQRTDHRHGNPRVAPFAALGRANLDRLSAYEWPGNFVELRDAAIWLHAVLLHGFRLRAAARFLGIAASTFADSLKRIGVMLKQVAEDADDQEIEGASLIETGAAPTPSIPVNPS